MSRYVIDASVAVKWFLPEVYSDAAWRACHRGAQLHVPALMALEVGNVVAKKIRRAELTRPEGDVILKELKQLPLQHHADERLFHAAYALACETHRSLYDCLYLALAEALESRMVTADRKFYQALAHGAYGHRVMWVEDLPPI